MTTATVHLTRPQVLELAMRFPDATLTLTHASTSLDLNGTTYVALSSGGDGRG